MLSFFCGPKDSTPRKHNIDQDIRCFVQYMDLCMECRVRAGSSNIGKPELRFPSLLTSMSRRENYPEHCQMIRYGNLSPLPCFAFSEDFLSRFD